MKEFSLILLMVFVSFLFGSLMMAQYIESKGSRAIKTYQNKQKYVEYNDTIYILKPVESLEDK